MAHIYRLIFSFFLLFFSSFSFAETIPATATPADIPRGSGGCVVGSQAFSSPTVTVDNLSACMTKGTTDTASATAGSFPNWYWVSGWTKSAVGTALRSEIMSRNYCKSATNCGWITNAQLNSSCPSGSTFRASDGTCQGTVYTCPSTGGWTLSGSTCTRPDCPAGVDRDAAGVCIQNCPVNQSASATIGVGWFPAGDGGIGLAGGSAAPLSAAARSICVQNGAYKCNANVLPGSLNLKNLTNGSWAVSANVSGALSGSECSGPITPADVTGAPPPCAGQSGTVNGLAVCIPTETEAQKRERAAAAAAAAAKAASAKARADAIAAGKTQAEADAAASAAALAAGRAASSAIMSGSSASGAAAAGAAAGSSAQGGAGHDANSAAGSGAAAEAAARAQAIARGLSQATADAAAAAAKRAAEAARAAGLDAAAAEAAGRAAGDAIASGGSDNDAADAGAGAGAGQNSSTGPGSGGTGTGTESGDGESLSDFCV